MAYSGMPTPDSISPQTFRCVQVFVPDVIGDEFFSVVLGQIGEMANAYYWKQQGDLTPEQAAFLMSQSLALTNADGLSCEDAMDCTDIADCVDTSIIVQNSINNTIIQSGAVNSETTNIYNSEMNYRFPPAERMETVKSPPPSCDKDALWAGIHATVTRLDEMCRDFYEDVIVSNDRVVRAQALIDIVPLFGDVIADSINVFTQVAPQILNGYNAHSSAQVIEDVACDFFDDVCPDCEYPTYDDYYNYFANLGISGIQDIAAYGVQAAIDYLIGTNGLAASVVWHSSIAIGLYIMYMGGEFANYRGTKWLAIWADVGEDNPNNGWELLCEPCIQTWCHHFDYTVDNLGYIGLPFGSSPAAKDWILGVGQEAIYTTPDYTMLGEQVFTETTLTKVNVKVWLGAQTNNSNLTLYGRKTDDTNEVLINNGINAPNTLYDLNWVGLASYKGLPLWLALSSSADISLRSMTVWGNGVNPFGIDNCP